MSGNIKLEKSWLDKLKGEFEKTYMKEIKEFLKNELESNKIIYPKQKLIFNALNLTTLDDVKVVIIGQDPYHGPNQAHGLSFSVQEGEKIPPSLRNIFKEIGKKDEKNGDLSYLAKQGVLLLNSILTVEKSKPASHSKIGWEKFTDKVIKVISEKKTGIVFLLWGAFAQKKKDLINLEKHHILQTTHPSPFSAHRGFLGSNCFIKTNQILKKEGKNEIHW